MPPDNIREIIDAGREHSHEPRIKALEDTSMETSRLVKEMHTALIGTMDKKGLVTTIREHDEFICEAKKSRVDWIRWVERAAAAAGFAWVVARLKGHA
jgi:hypothetical protein